MCHVCYNKIGARVQYVVLSLVCDFLIVYLRMLIGVYVCVHFLAHLCMLSRESECMNDFLCVSVCGILYQEIIAGKSF